MGSITLAQLARSLEVTPSAAPHPGSTTAGCIRWRLGSTGSPGAPPSIERRLMLGLLSLGPSAVVSHEAAARLHGFDRCLPDAVEFTVSDRSRRNADIPFPSIRPRVLPPIDRVKLAGYPCTSATRTIIDLARARIPKVRLGGGDRLRRPLAAQLAGRARSPPRRAPRPRPMGRPHARSSCSSTPAATRCSSALPAVDADGWSAPPDAAGRSSPRRPDVRPGRLHLREQFTSSSRSPGARGTRPTPSEPRTPNGATSSRTSAARSTSTRTTR